MDKETVEQLIFEIDHIRQVNKLSKKEMAQKLNIPYSTFKKWFSKIKRLPSIANIKKIENLLGSQKPPSIESNIEEAQQRVAKVKNILLLLEKELNWFRNSSKKERDVFRNKLDLNDIGYISSLLTMMGEEDKFKRWVTLTTNKFNYFKKKEKQK